MENNKIEFAKQLILKHFSFLITKGFSVDFEIKINKFFSEYLIMRYVNEEKKRRLSISYTKGEVNEDMKYSFNANIVRLPYSGPGDFFSLDSFLESIGRNFSTTLVNHFNEQEAIEIVRKIAEALQTYASKIIDGTEWYEDYYPQWH